MAVFRPVSSAEHESEHSPPVLFPLGRKLIKLIKISRSQTHVWHLSGPTTAHAHKHPGAHTLLPSLYSATFKLLNTSDLLRHKPLVMAALPASLSARLFPVALASTGVFKGGCRPPTHASLGFPFHFSLFVTSSLNLQGGWHVWCDCHLLRQSSGGHG